MEDLKDLAENGLTDLFEYGQEFMVGGNALGDNSKKNTTDGDKKQQESFAEKYRRELKKDIDDLGADEEEIGDLGEEDTKEEEEGAGKSINLDDLMNDDEDESTDAESGEADGTAEAKAESAKDL